MHLFIAAFIYLGLTQPGSVITTADINDHQEEIQDVKDDPEFIKFCERVADNAGVTVIYNEDLN